MPHEEILTLSEWGKKFEDDYGKRLTDLSKVNAGDIVEIAEKVGSHIVKSEYRDKGKIFKIDLKMNQIRKFLDAVRQIEASLKGNKKFEEVKDTITLLRPKLAYAAGRDEKVKLLMNVLDPAIRSGADSPSNFEKLLRFIESIIAYHRYYGGKN